MIRLLVDSVDGVHHIALLLIALPPEGEGGRSGSPISCRSRRSGQCRHRRHRPRRPARTRRRHRTRLGADAAAPGGGHPAAHARRSRQRASLALLARAGRVSSGLPEQGVLDVTVELPAAIRARSAVENVADLWTQGARRFLDQTYLLSHLSQVGLIPAVDRYFEFTRRIVELNSISPSSGCRRRARCLVWPVSRSRSSRPVTPCVSGPPWPGGRSPARLGAAEALIPKQWSLEITPSARGRHVTCDRDPAVDQVTRIEFQPRSSIGHHRAGALAGPDQRSPAAMCAYGPSRPSQEHRT